MAKAALAARAPPLHTWMLIAIPNLVCLPPLRSGDEAVLDQFVAFFSGAQLDKGTEVTLLWRAGARHACKPACRVCPHAMHCTSCTAAAHKVAGCGTCTAHGSSSVAWHTCPRMGSHGCKAGQPIPPSLPIHPLADGGTDVCLCPPGTSTPYSAQQPGLRVSRALGHALWQLYLGPTPPAPDARKAWLRAVAEL